MKQFFALLLSCLLLFSFVSCGRVESGSTSTGGTSGSEAGENTPASLFASAANLMRGIAADESVATKPADDDFLSAYASFALPLFAKTAEAQAEENLMISPLSAMAALALLQNGAAGDSLAALETLLGGLDRDSLNAYLGAYLASLPESDALCLHSASAMWFKDDPFLKIKDTFLQTNANYYGAAALQAPFDEATREAINRWVSDMTDGMIPSLLESISPESVAFLINALSFAGRWETTYRRDDILHRHFTQVSGDTVTAEFLFRVMDRYYIDPIPANAADAEDVADAADAADGEQNAALGFRLSYAKEEGDDGAYSFFAILPPSGMSPEAYAATLTPARLAAMLASPCGGAEVLTYLPTFAFDTSLDFCPLFAAMGLDLADLDLSAMGSFGGDPLTVSSVVQKTHVEVTPEGVKAAASTVVEVAPGAAPDAPPPPIVSICLDRPFVFMILDPAGLPLFLGIVNNI